MSWTYSQSTGELRHDGKRVGQGYSGAGMTAATGRNNPAMQGVVNQGPIPTGQWSIGPAYDDPHGKGPIVMALTPVGHNMAGRDGGFLIHGNNSTNNASEGCIILGPAIRKKIKHSKDKVWIVVP